MAEFILNKLVRNEIPVLMESAGQTPVVRRLEGAAQQRAILEKIKEEANEAIAALDNPDATVFDKEVADIRQGVDDLILVRGIDTEALNALQKAIKDKKGGFDKAYFVASVIVPEGSEWEQYYRNEPGRFLEITAGSEAGAPTIQTGAYRHYKGGQYEVIGLARHSETEEIFVAYRPLYDHDSSVDIWVRPYDMFVGEVVIDGASVPRFKKV